MFRSLQDGQIAQGTIPNTLTITEVGELLHVHAQTLRRWANSGLIRTYRVGPRGDRRFSPDDVAAFLQKNAEGMDGGHQSS
jgi:excisionase family DNA binding protein